LYEEMKKERLKRYTETEREEDLKKEKIGKIKK
jgi:hypothetical protein